MTAAQGCRGNYNETLTHSDEIDAILQTIFWYAFLEQKCTDFNKNFTDVYSQKSNSQYSSIGLDNGLVPTRQQAIIWTNDDYLTDACMCHSALMS